MGQAQTPELVPGVVLAVEAASCWPCHDLRTNQKCTLVHWTSGRTPSPGQAALRAPVMERPRSHSGLKLSLHSQQHSAATTTWPISIKVHNACLWVYTCHITAVHNWVCCVHMVRLCLGSPGLDWMDRLSWHQLIVVTRSLSPAQQPRCCCTLPQTSGLRTRLATAQLSSSSGRVQRNYVFEWPGCLEY